MPSLKLENIKAKHKSLSDKLDSLADMIQKAGEHGDVLIPRVVARQLRISEADALALLMLFEDAGWIRHRYDVLCPKSRAVLFSVYDKNEIADEEYECKFCGAEHACDDLEIELVFEIPAAGRNARTDNAA
jgi:hypothetical protein